MRRAQWWVLMSLLRTATIVAIGITLLPSDEASQQRLYERTASAVHWTATFCDRNGATCENAAALWEAFLAKAEFAARLTYDAAQRYAAAEPAPGTAPAPAGMQGNGLVQRGTLTGDDLKPAWRGPTRQGI
jgi:hypothetical protein